MMSLSLATTNATKDNSKNSVLSSSPQAIPETSPISTTNKIINNNTINNNGKISSKDLILQRTTTTSSIQRTLQHNNTNVNTNQYSISVMQECSAVKKGLLWERQQTRFLFNRWKERFFILTADYLTCFKKGSKKVGMSEMGSFVYKINLNEIKNLNWVDKKKNGVIGVQLANTVIFLWNNTDTILDEWMAVLQDSTIRTKDRRNTLTAHNGKEPIRKSATLMPNMITNNNNNVNISSKYLKADLIDRNDSLSLRLRNDSTNIDKVNGLVPVMDIIPPPPPPRRYLRCVSTDLGRMSPSIKNESKLVLTPTLSRNSMVNHTPVQNILNSPQILSQRTIQKINLDKDKGRGMINFQRKSSDVSTASSSLSQQQQQHNISQSLRCKSSYSMKLSPLITVASTTINHNNPNNNTNSNLSSPTSIQLHQRRLASKRLSAFNNNNNILNELSLNNNHHHHDSTSKSSSNFKSADSEFTFVNSRAATFKYSHPPNNHNVHGIDIDSIVNGKNHRTNESITSDINSNNSKFITSDRNSKHVNSFVGNNNLNHRSTISSSASLMLNHNNTKRNNSANTNNDHHHHRFLAAMETPPPIPPHRSHLHHF